LHCIFPTVSRRRGDGPNGFLARFWPDDLAFVAVGDFGYLPEWRIGRRVEHLDCRTRRGRAEVRIAHRHLDRRMTEELLNDLERNPSHHEMRCEGVPERMPADPAQLCCSARAPERPLALRLAERRPTLVTEHPRPAPLQALLALKRGHRLI